MKIISVLDRFARTYYMFKCPSEVKELLSDQTLEELNSQYELAIDGHIVGWPHTDPDLVEQYIHEFLYDKSNRLPD